MHQYWRKAQQYLGPLSPTGGPSDNQTVPGDLEGKFFSPDISCGLSTVCPEPNVDGLFDGPTAVISWLLVLTQVLH